MKLAYADPPYPGQAKLYRKHPDFRGEVDHAELVERLDAEYEGWALSTNNVSLHYVLGLCPDYVRVAAWCNPNSQPFASRSVIPSWEPIIYRPGRLKVERARTRDYLVTSNLGGFVDMNRDREHAIIGQKPPAFIVWLFDLLGAVEEDTLDDLFPGSGAVTREWNAWRQQMRLAV